MQCYYPLKQGGIRAFYKTDPNSTPCLGRTTGTHGSNNEMAVGLFAHGSNGIVSGAPADNLLLVTHNSNDHKDRVYEWKGICASPQTTWCVADSSASFGGDIISPNDFGFFYDGANYYYLLVLRGQHKGLWAITFRSDCGQTHGDQRDDGWTQTIDSNKTGPLGLSGSRLVIGDGAQGNKLWWSTLNPLALSFDAGAFTIAYPNDIGSGLRMIVSMQPDQFLVGRGGGSWIQFSGDIGTTGTSREMSADHTPGGNYQQACRVPGGIAFIENGGYIYVTDGNTFENISPQLPQFSATLYGAQSASQLQSPGKLAFSNGFLFAPDGKVMHWDTKSWFTLEDSTAQVAATPAGVYYTIREDGSPVNYISMFQGSGAVRATKGLVQTAPFADKDGRNVEIREVQLFFQAYTDGTSVTCDIYNGEDEFVMSRTPEGGNAFDAGRAEARFLFAYPKDEYLSVRICTDGNGGEAPTIERLRIGFGQNNDILGI